MLVLLGLGHLLCVFQPVGSATLKSLSDHSKHQSTVSTQEGYVLEVGKSASHVRGITSPSQYVANSGCYTYLQEKDGCVYANPTNNCARKMSSMAVQIFATSPAANNVSSNISSLPAPSGKTYFKRSEEHASSSATPPSISPAEFNSPSGSSGLLENISLPSPNLSGTSICEYHAGEEQMGVCLWSGPSNSQGGDAGGWVSSDFTANCNKEVILQRIGSNSPLIVARVLEGCSFNTTQPSIGCSQVYITKEVFMALKPSPSELEKGALEEPITWDFNSRGNIFNSAV